MSLNSPFLKGLQEKIRMRGYSIRTEKTYLYWIKAFINSYCSRAPQGEYFLYVRHDCCNRSLHGRNALFTTAFFTAHLFQKQ